MGGESRQAGCCCASHVRQSQKALQSASTGKGEEVADGSAGRSGGGTCQHGGGWPDQQMQAMHRPGRYSPRSDHIQLKIQ